MLPAALLIFSQFDQKTETSFDDLLERSYTLVLRMKIIFFNNLLHGAFSSERNAHVFSGKKTPPRRVNNQS